MEVSNNYAIQPQFKAAFKTVNITQNNSRWNRIGRMFQEATKDIPQDTLVLGYSKEDVRPFFFFTLNNSENRPDMVRLQDLGDWILTKSNKEISAKLVKLFNGMKIRHDSIDEYRNVQKCVNAGNKKEERILGIIEKFYAENMLAANKDDQEILNIFGADYKYDRTGIIAAFRANYINCKNCW